MKSTGVTSQVIKHKMPLRMVQNYHTTFNNVFVTNENKLPTSTDFAKGAAVVLKHCRVFV